MLNCRSFTDPIRGYAPTLDGAKRIVETLLYETNTALKAPEIEKDDLYFMIISLVDLCMAQHDGSPASQGKIFDLFGLKGTAKLREMVNAGIILEASNGMLSMPDWFLSGKKNPAED